MYIFCQDVRSSNVRADDVGYDLYIFVIRYQEKVRASLPLKVEFKLDGVFPDDINGYALVLKNELVSIGSDGQRHFDLN